MPFRLTPQPDSGRSFTSTIHTDTYEAIDPTKADMTGRAVLITGASRGLGRAMALSYALAGASMIAVTGRQAPEALPAEIADRCRAKGRPAPRVVLPLALEVTSLASVEAAAREVRHRFARLDVLVSNAGHLAPFVPILEGDPEDWWRGWDVNVRGFYNCLRAFLPLVLGSGDDDALKTVVNVTSSGAHLVHVGAASYEGSKHAVERLVEFAMSDYGDQGLLCYSFHPGGVRTELSMGLPEELYGNLSDTPELGGDSLVFLTQKRREWLAARYVSARWDMPELLSREEEIAGGDKLKIRLVL